jgi:hypothetical protein
VLGFVSVIPSVTHHLTGFVPSPRLVRSGHRHRPGRSDWPDQELDRQMVLARPVTVLPISEPDRNRTSLSGKEKNA